MTLALIKPGRMHRNDGPSIRPQTLSRIVVHDRPRRRLRVANFVGVMPAHLPDDDFAWVGKDLFGALEDGL